jgi:hypothetical protein
MERRQFDALRSISPDLAQPLAPKAGWHLLAITVWVAIRVVGITLNSPLIEKRKKKTRALFGWGQTKKKLCLFLFSSCLPKGALVLAFKKAHQNRDPLHRTNASGLECPGCGSSRCRTRNRRRG